MGRLGVVSSDQRNVYAREHPIGEPLSSQPPRAVSAPAQTALHESHRRLRLPRTVLRFLAGIDRSTTAELVCKRRSKNPSVKRPIRSVAPE